MGERSNGLYSFKMTRLLRTLAASCLLLANLYDGATGQTHLCGRALADTLDMVCAGRGFHLGKRSARSVRSPGQPPVSDAHGDISAPSGSGFSSGPFRVAASQPEVRRTQSFLSLLNSKLESKHLVSKPETSGGSYFSKAASHALSNGNRNTVGGYPSDVTGLASPQATQANVNEDVDDGEDDTELRDARSAVKSRRERVRRSGESVVDECCLRACTFATLESYCAAADEPVQELSMEELRRRLGLSVGGVTPSPRGQGRFPAPRLRPSAEIIRNRGSNRSSPFFYLSLGNQATRSPLIE